MTTSPGGGAGASSKSPLSPGRPAVSGTTAVAPAFAARRRTTTRAGRTAASLPGTAPGAEDDPGPVPSVLPAKAHPEPGPDCSMLSSTCTSEATHAYASTRSVHHLHPGPCTNLKRVETILTQLINTYTTFMAPPGVVFAMARARSSSAATKGGEEVTEARKFSCATADTQANTSASAHTWQARDVSVQGHCNHDGMAVANTA